MAHPHKKKILILIDFIYALTGGTENQVIKLINGLDREKFEITLMTLRQSTWMEKNRSSLHCSSYSFDFYKFKEWHTYYNLLRVLLKILSLSPDVALTFFSVSNSIGVLLLKLCGVKRVISTRRDYGLWFNRKNFNLLRIANLSTERILVNSNIIKTLIINKERIPPEKIAVIYNGIHLSSFSAFSSRNKSLWETIGIPPDHKIVGIVGGLKPMKCHFTFIAAARIILSTRNDISFIIVGDGPLRQLLIEFCNYLGISSRMYFVGSQDDVRPYVSLFDIAVNCSANEGLSNAIMEYMASGKASIVSDAGGNPELINDKHNGLIFKLHDYMELADKILYLLENPEKRQNFGVSAQKVIENNFSIDKMLDRFSYYLQPREHDDI